MACDCEKKTKYNFWTSYNIFNALKDTWLSLFGKKGVWVDKHKRIDRLSICDVCQQNSIGRCKICGCILMLKVKYTGSSCPEGKW